MRVILEKPYTTIFFVLFNREDESAVTSIEIFHGLFDHTIIGTCHSITSICIVVVLFPLLSCIYPPEILISKLWISLTIVFQRRSCRRIIATVVLHLTIAEEIGTIRTWDRDQATTENVDSPLIPASSRITMRYTHIFLEISIGNVGSFGLIDPV